MKKFILVLLCGLIAPGAAGCAAKPGAEMTPQPTAVETRAPEVQPTATPLNTPTEPVLPSPTATASPNPTFTPLPTGETEYILRFDQTEIFCSSENDQAVDYYNEALLKQEAGNLEGAIEGYLQAIELDPGYCDAMDNLGLLYRYQGELEEAVYWYKESLAVYPENAVARQNLAVAYVFQKQYEQALGEYQTLIDLYPTNPEGYFGLGQVYLETGMLDEAVESFKQAEVFYESASSPYIVDARYSLGITYMLMGDYSSARGYFEAIYDDFDDVPLLNYYIGVCYLMIPGEDISEGRKYILKAQEAGLEIPEYILAIIEE